MPAKVAIVTRTRNRLPLLKRALDSVAGQTLGDWVHVIVNDGGDREALDTLLGSLPEGQAGRLRVLHHPESKGMQVAANAGIEATESTYICIHDDDDAWYPDFLAEVTAYLDEQGPDSPYQGVITGTEEIRESIGEDGEIREISRKRHIPLDEISLFRLGYENPFPPIAFCYRRAAWEQVGPYNPRWDVIGDLDFNLRFLLDFEIGIIDRMLACYHIREGAESGELGNSISDKQALHKRLFTEFKNTHLRKTLARAGGDSLGLGLNVAPYLVEAQWMVHDLFHRLQTTEEALLTLSQAVALEGYEDRFETVRQALAILVDHARDPGMRQAVDGIGRDLESAARARQALSARLEEVVRALGLPAGSGDNPNVRSLVEDLLSRDRGEELVHGLQGIHQDIADAARARQALSARLEEVVRALGLPAETEGSLNLRSLVEELAPNIRAIQLDNEAAKKTRQFFLGQIEALLRGLQGIHQDITDAARARQALSARLEEVVRTIGLYGEEAGPSFLERLTQVHDFIQDPSRNGLAFRDELVHRLARLEERLQQLETRSTPLRIGKLQIGTVGPRPAKPEEPS